MLTCHATFENNMSTLIKWIDQNPFCTQMVNNDLASIGASFLPQSYYKLEPSVCCPRLPGYAGLSCLRPRLQTRWSLSCRRVALDPTVLMQKLNQLPELKHQMVHTEIWILVPGQDLAIPRPYSQLATFSTTCFTPHCCKT